MKKITLVLLLAMLLSLAVPFFASAETWYINENPVLTISNKTPVIDGTISADEGWGTQGWLDIPTYIGAYSSNAMTGTVDFNFAYTDEGLYFAANLIEYGASYSVRFYDDKGETLHDNIYIDENAANYKLEEGGYPATTPDGHVIEYYRVDNTSINCPPGVMPNTAIIGIYKGDNFQYCTGEDDIDEYAGWNGDVIGVTFDLLGAWENEGFLNNEDYTPFYNFGLFEDGSVRVHRNKSTNDGEITEHCITAGKATEKGFCFEAMIPWDIIIADQNDHAAVLGLETVFTKENVLAAGATHRAMVAWQDRFYDEEAEMIDTWSRFVTVCAESAMGIEGFHGNGASIAYYGLKLQIEGGTEDTTAPEGEDTTTAPVNNDDTSKADDTTKAGDTTKASATTTKKGATTTKAASTGKPATGTSSTQTFDAGIAVAIGTLAASALGVVYSKKRRH